MKTEDFDEAIRKKLESVSQTYTEADIGRVFSHVQHHKGFLPRGFTGTNLLYTILVAAFTGLIVWNVLQMRESRLIETRIDTLQHNLKQVAAQIELAPADSTHDSATVATSPAIQGETVNSRVGKSHVHQTTSLTVQDETARQRNPGTNTSAAVDAPATSHPASATVNQIAPTSVAANMEVARSIPRLLTTVATIQPRRVTPIEPTTPHSQNTIRNRQIPRIAITANTKTEADEKSSRNAVHQKTGPTIAVVDKVSRKTKTRRERTTKPTRLRTEKPGNGKEWLTSTEWRAGLQLEVTNYQKGAGLTGEWVVNNLWSLMSGLRYSVLNAEHFDDRDDYLRDKNRMDDPFLIRPHEPDGQPRNIDLDNKLLQVPLAVRYYIPLKTNTTSLFVTAGTNLDIVLFQRAQYDRPTDSLLHVHEEISNTTNPTLFNNLFLGAGVQYTRRKWGLQAGLLIGHSLNTTPYKPSGLEYGMNLTLIYRFSQ